MNVNFLLDPQAVAVKRLGTRHEILAALADQFEAVYGLDRAAVIEGLEQRETLGSTGFGRGVAFPHCRVPTIKRPRVALLKLEHPVDFEAVDTLPVWLVFGLVSPEDGGAIHLYTLAALSRLSRDEVVLQALRDAPDADAIFAVLTNQFLRDAA